MEALAQDPASGPDAYIVGGEASGQTWVCRLSSGCQDSFRLAKDDAFGLSAVAPLPGGGWSVPSSSGGSYRVALEPEPSCECLWVAGHGTARGPCKHILAVLLGRP
jgi:hypothetical protein